MDCFLYNGWIPVGERGMGHTKTQYFIILLYHALDPFSRGLHFKAGAVTPYSTKLINGS
jgi:hypothetical protein